MIPKQSEPKTNSANLDKKNSSLLLKTPARSRRQQMWKADVREGRKSGLQETRKGSAEPAGAAPVLLDPGVFSQKKASGAGQALQASSPVPHPQQEAV